MADRRSAVIEEMPDVNQFFASAAFHDVLDFSLHNREPLFKRRVLPVESLLERIGVDAKEHVFPAEIDEQIVVPHNFVTVLVSAVLVLIDLDAQPKKASMGVFHESSQVDSALGCTTTSGEIDVEGLVPNPVEGGKPLDNGVYPLDFFGFGAHLGGPRVVWEQIGEAVGAESVVFVSCNNVSALSGMLAVPKTNLGPMAISTCAPSLSVLTNI